MFALLFLIVLLVFTIWLVFFVMAWAKKYLSRSYEHGAREAGASRPIQRVAAAPDRERVFMTNKGPRMYAVDVQGMPIVKRV